jgi:hypothetical protein
MTIQPRADAAPTPASPRRRSIRALVEWPLLVLVIAGGLGTWGHGIVARIYDHDEFQRAHSVWLASQGLRPYSELFEVHPPYFILLTPILRSWPDPCVALRALRVFSLVGNLLFLGGLIALGWSADRRRNRWTWLGVAWIAFDPGVLDFLVEFRIDGWGYALAAWSLVAFQRGSRTGWRFATFGAGSGIATLLFCPKLALLPPLVVLFELARSRPAARAALRLGAAYLAGMATAGLFFALFLGVNRIALDRTYLLLFRYHTLSNAHSAFHLGLLRRVAAAPFLAIPIILGMLVWALDAVKKMAIVDAYTPAVGVWLVIQALLVAYPYKQYSASWFLFASAFVIVAGRAVEGLWGWPAHLLFIAACVVTIQSVGVADLGIGLRPNRFQCTAIRIMNVLARPDDRVVAPPSEHPIVRRDVFFLWFNTSDPRGYDSERILQALGPFAKEVSLARNRTALEANPPALVVLDAGPFAARYPDDQWRALLEFLPRHGYHAVRLHGIGGGLLRLALRDDRYGQLQGSGLFEDSPGPLGPIMPASR